MPSAKSVHLPQLSRCLLLDLLPQGLTFCHGETAHFWERFQEHGVHKLLEGFHGATVQLLK